MNMDAKVCIGLVTKQQQQPNLEKTFIQHAVNRASQTPGESVWLVSANIFL